MAIDYLFPGAGAVPATAAQASFAARQVATFDLITTDTTTTFIHNWGFDAAALVRLCPHVIEFNGVGAARGEFGVTSRSADEVVFDLTISVAGTFEVVLDRPHSLIMPNS